MESLRGLAIPLHSEYEGGVIELQDRAYSIDHDLFPQMVAKESLWVYETEDRYFDMGTHDGLKELENFLDPPTGRLHVGSRSTQ